MCETKSTGKLQTTDEAMIYIARTHIKEGFSIKETTPPWLAQLCRFHRNQIGLSDDELIVIIRKCLKSGGTDHLDPTLRSIG